MKCKGTNRQGEPCGNWAIKGGTVCDDHGGKAPQVVAAAKARVLEDKARRLMPATFEPMADPIRTLLEKATEAEVFRAIVLELVDNMKSWGSWSPELGSQIRAEVMLYERALDRVTRIIVDIAKLNLGDRLVQVRESEARMLADALDYALTAAGISPEQALTVKRETAARLRSVA